MRITWNEHSALSLLRNWIDDGKWEGTVHFRKHNSSLYEFLYRTIGMDSAFKKLGLKYSDFKKSKGKHQKIRQDKEVINELHSLIKENKWKGVRHLQKNHSLLYREISRIGFAQAFNRIGLDYKEFRYTIWNQDDMLNELKEIIENEEWKGTLHLKKYNSKLYNAIAQRTGFSKAFNEIGLNYDDYKYK